MCSRIARAEPGTPHILTTVRKEFECRNKQQHQVASLQPRAGHRWRAAVVDLRGSRDRAADDRARHYGGQHRAALGAEGAAFLKQQPRVDRDRVRARVRRSAAGRGRLGDLFGRKRLFVASTIGFAAASAIGGAAQSFGMLVAARGLQGVFAALMAPAALSLVSNDLHQSARARHGVRDLGSDRRRRRRDRAAARRHPHPRPVVALDAVRQPRLRDRRRGRRRGAAAPRRKLGPRADRRPRNADRDGRPVRARLRLRLRPESQLGVLHDDRLPFGRSGAARRVRRDPKRATHPLMPLRVVLDRNRGGSYLALGIAGLGLFGVFLFLTYYLQQTEGYSPIRTGLAFLPLSGAVVIGAAIANARVVPHTGPRPVIASGMALTAIAMGLFAQLGVHSSYVAAPAPRGARGRRRGRPHIRARDRLRRPRRRASRRRGRLRARQRNQPGRRLPRAGAPQHPSRDRHQALPRGQAPKPKRHRPRRRTRLHHRVLVGRRILRRGRAHNRTATARPRPADCTANRRRRPASTGRRRLNPANRHSPQNRKTGTEATDLPGRDALPNVHRKDGPDELCN